MSNKFKVKYKSKNKESDKLTDFINRVLKERNIKVNKEQINLISQIIKFIIVGGIATLIDWALFYILYNLVKINPLIANIISFTISLIYNYLASVKYVFKVTKDKTKKRLFIEFIILSVIGLGINELFIYIFVTLINLNAMIVKVVATSIVMVFNFITRKIFLEEKKK